MKKSKEPKALAELHQIREDMAREARKTGVTKYYLAMNKRSKWQLGAERKAQNAKVPLTVRERTPRKYGSR